MITIILSFIQSKLGKQLIIGLLITASLFIGYNYIFNRGVNYQKTLYQAEYLQTLNKLLLEQKTKQEQAFKQGIESVKIQTKIVTVYKDRENSITEYIKLNPSNSLCKRTDKEKDMLNKLMEDVK